MYKKAITLITLITLATTASGGTHDQFYVNDFNETIKEWLTQRDEPWIFHNSEGNIYTAATGQEMDWFGIADTNIGTDQIDSATLWIKCRTSNTGDPQEGTIMTVMAPTLEETEIGTIWPTSITHTWYSLDASDEITTKAIADAMQIGFESTRSGQGAYSSIIVIEAYIDIEHSEATTECDCPEEGHWNINNGTQCTLTEACALQAGDLHITNGTLAIATTGTLTIENGQKIIIEQNGTIILENGGKIIIE